MLAQIEVPAERQHLARELKIDKRGPAMKNVAKRLRI